MPHSGEGATVGQPSSERQIGMSSYDGGLGSDWVVGMDGDQVGMGLTSDFGVAMWVVTTVSWLMLVVRVDWCLVICLP